MTENSEVNTNEAPITREKFLTDIKQYCSRVQISPTEFGKRVFNDGSFYHRVEDGRSPTLTRIEEAYKYMAAHPLPHAVQTGSTGGLLDDLLR